MKKIKPNENEETSNGSEKAKSKGKTAKELMSKHITDKNDVISDEDFKNLDLHFEEDPQSPPEISNNEERPKDEEKDPETLTPWSVIKE